MTSPGFFTKYCAINVTACIDPVVKAIRSTGSDTPSLRSKRSARATALESLEPVLAGEAKDEPDRVQGSAEIRQVIRDALAKMSPRAAEVFALRYFEGYGNNEIAKLLGTSRSTINVILHRTRQKLKEEIGPYVGEER